jgi:7,8-dihydropterin-6-yl-methyl-4-(beta-D-ribofuranosyl)aminobenzene 5'-phosphate synthase
MKKTGYTDDELRQIVSMGTELMRYSTKFVTCHCTGDTAYEIMKNVLGDQLQYVHSGESVEVKGWR